MRDARLSKMMREEIRRIHRMLTLQIDRESADRARLTAFAEHAAALGLTFTTLAAERAVDGEAAIEAAYLCHNECRRRQPPVELRTDPIPFTAWRQGFVDGIDALPHAYFLARDSATGTFVAVCALVLAPGKSDCYSCGFTGVLPTWNGKRIALALKAHALLWAMNQPHITRIETRILQVNRPIRKINDLLGFKIVQQHMHTFMIPAPVETPLPASP